MNNFNTFLQPARSENDERKKRRASLVKLAVMLVLTLIIWIFSSIDSHTF
ncbi:MAG: hypothetical protein IKW87_12710 [Ruminococcus sp.]|nr:hypothetical protein [Ruminococcus sp.]